MTTATKPTQSPVARTISRAVVGAMLAIGEYTGIVKACNVSISSERPAIFTRCALEQPEVIKQLHTSRAKFDELLAREEITKAEYDREIMELDAISPYHDLTHVVRAVNAQSLRIGCDELRSGFPEVFADCKNPEDVIVLIMTKPELLEGKKVHIGIEYQTDGNGEVQKDPQTHRPYFNVRIRPNTRNLSEEVARKLAKQIIGGIVTKEAAKGATEGVA